MPRREIAALIKHLIVGQALLAVSAENFPAFDERDSIVEEATLTQRITDQHVHRQIRREQALQRLVDTSLQAWPQKQILGGITGQCQFRKGDDVGGVLDDGLLRRSNHPLCVALDVPYQQIQLGHNNGKTPWHTLPNCPKGTYGYCQTSGILSDKQTA